MQCVTPNDRVVVIATTPLTTNETWQAMQSGQMVYFCEGQVTQVL
ncbi:MAG TPA: class II glutamine amidotransferase [Agitococcus sp.]|nr:class II glutamine amidotransferase [Agitococcus sp.]